MSPVPQMNTTIDPDLINNLWNTTNSANQTYFTNQTNIETNFTSSGSFAEYNQTIINLFQIICNSSSPLYNSAGFDNKNIYVNETGFIDDFYDDYNEFIYPINNCSNFF